MASPVISVIINTLNAGLYLREALQSIIQQDYPHTEILIHDGASTDNTLDIIREFEKHIAFWDSFKDKAPIPDHLIQKSTGDLIILFGADDWYENGVFQKAADTYTDDEPDIITFGSRLVREENNQWVESARYCGEKTLSLSLEHIFYGASSIGSRFFKRSFYDRVGAFKMLDEQGHVNLSNDKEFLIRAMNLRPHDVFVESIALNYRCHPGSNSFSGRNENKIRLAKEHCVLAKQFMGEAPLFYKKLLADMRLRISFYSWKLGVYRNSFYFASRAIIEHPVIVTLLMPRLFLSWLKTERN